MSSKFYNHVYTRQFEQYVEFVPNFQNVYIAWERANRFYQRAIAEKRFDDARKQLEYIRQAENASMELHAMCGGGI